MKKLLVILFVLSFFMPAKAQILIKKNQDYTRADTLRGSLRPERTDFDVLKYELTLSVEPQKRFISGVNEISFKVLEELPRMQIDLFANMNVDSILYQGKKMKYEREFDAVFISFEEALEKNSQEKISFYYSGNPIVAQQPPWDGGFVFTKDQDGNPWVATAVQGIGASLWYPNKDHQSDEPDNGVLLHIAVPNGLMNVSNGRLVGKKGLNNGFTQWSWQTKNPINNYNVSLNIGNYTHFSEKYQDLDLNYYVLPYNLEKAQKQFQEVKPMMDCFYAHFGSYPFVEDGFKLVETPYLGMEHQSAVAYGNQYVNGYLGQDISGTGIGLKFDFIIIHESAHEWFGNSITVSDIADMWVHEGFTTYAEAVYVECRWGKQAALEYLFGLRKIIQNNTPIIGDYGVNDEGSGDMYAKGANLINTIRSVINDDEKWWKILKDFSLEFKYSTTNTKEVIAFFEKESGMELEAIFNQYLRYPHIPVLEMKLENGKLWCRWNVDVPKFNMPVDLIVEDEQIRIYPQTEWRPLKKKFYKAVASSRKDQNETYVFDIDLKRFYVNAKFYGKEKTD